MCHKQIIISGIAFLVSTPFVPSSPVTPFLLHGPPLFLLPSCAQVIAMLKLFPLACLKMWPVIFHLLNLDSSLTDFTSAFASNSSVLTGAIFSVHAHAGFSVALFWNRFTSFHLRYSSSVLRYKFNLCLRRLCKVWSQHITFWISKVKHYLVLKSS